MPSKRSIDIGAEPGLAVADMPQLQIVGQYCHHDDAMIIGTADALRALRNLIDGAIVNEAAAAEFMPSDGEGYTTVVKCVSAAYMDTCPTSYAFESGVPHQLYEMAVERNKRDADAIEVLRLVDKARRAEVAMLKAEAQEAASVIDDLRAQIAGG